MGKKVKVQIKYHSFIVGIKKNQIKESSSSCGEPEFSLDGVNCDFYTDINTDGHIISGEKNHKA